MRKSCTVCSHPFEAKRSRAKYCGPACRQRAHRRPESAQTGEVVPLEPTAPEQSAAGGGSVYAATLAELTAVDRVESAAGQAALALAGRIDRGFAETGSAYASLVREYRATLAEAVKDAKAADDPMDELKRRRELKLGG